MRLFRRRLVPVVRFAAPWLDALRPCCCAIAPRRMRGQRPHDGMRKSGRRQGRRIGRALLFYFLSEMTYSGVSMRMCQHDDGLMRPLSPIAARAAVVAEARDASGSDGDAAQAVETQAGADAPRRLGWGMTGAMLADDRRTGTTTECADADTGRRHDARAVATKGNWLNWLQLRPNSSGSRGVGHGPGYLGTIPPEPSRPCDL